MPSTRTRGSCQSSKLINHFALRVTKPLDSWDQRQHRRSACQGMWIREGGIVGPRGAIRGMVASSYDVGAEASRLCPYSGETAGREQAVKRARREPVAKLMSAPVPLVLPGQLTTAMSPELFSPAAVAHPKTVRRPSKVVTWAARQRPRQRAGSVNRSVVDQLLIEGVWNERRVDLARGPEPPVRDDRSPTHRHDDRTETIGHDSLPGGCHGSHLSTCGSEH